jgi:hypothetical protein
MTTTAYVLGAALVVVAELAFAILHYDGAAVSDRAARLESRLDRELHDWVLPSLGGQPQDTAAEHAGPAAPRADAAT